ncbi:MAG: hypothetical protein ACI9HK_001477 [Pirellulaceae bacterium]|jgi:hypothetical protein
MNDQSQVRTSTFDRALMALAIEPVAFRALMKAYLLMDFRNQQFGRATHTGPKELITPLFWVLGQNLLICLCFCGVLFARVDIYFFAMLAIGVSMAITATSLIVEFNEVVLSPDDMHVLSHQPIPIRTYSAARVANLLIYLGAIILSLNLFPPIVIAGFKEALWWHGPALFFVSVTGSLVVAAVVILIYVLLLTNKNLSNIQEVLAWVQAGFIAVFFYGGQYLLRDSTQEIQWVAYRLPAWIFYTPPAWLATVIQDLGMVNQWQRWAIGIGSAILAMLMWLVVVAVLSKAYSQLQPGATAWDSPTLKPLPKPGQLLPDWTFNFLRSRDEQTGYWLSSTILRRDLNLTMRCWPTMGVVFAVVLLGWGTEQLNNPFYGVDKKCVLSLAGVYLLAMPIPTIFYNLRFSRDHQAAWILQASPIRDRFEFTNGLRKAVLLRFFAPATLLMLLIFSAAWREPLHVAVHLLLGWLVVLGTSSVCQMVQLRKLPFSSPLARGQSFGPIALFAAAVSAVLMALATVHYFAIQNTVAFSIYIAALLVAVVVARNLAKRSLNLVSNT